MARPYNTRPWDLPQADSAESDERPLAHGGAGEEDWSFLQPLYRHPGPLKDIPQVSAGAHRKVICVIGGGLAGLAAAYELAEAGCRVTLLEASNRWGGRVQTCYFNADGTSDSTPVGTSLHGELGPMRIPPEHGCVRYYIDRFNLTPMRAFIQRNDDALYRILGETRPKKHWQQFSFIQNTSSQALLEPP